MAMDQMYTDALKELEQVKVQRDQLREALEELDTALRNAWSEGRLPHDVICPYLAQKTSAALNATENE